MGKKGFFSAAKRRRELAKQEKKKKKAERREARRLENQNDGASLDSSEIESVGHEADQGVDE